MVFRIQAERPKKWTILWFTRFWSFLGYITDNQCINFGKPEIM